MRLVLLVVLAGCFNAPPAPSARPTLAVTPADAAHADAPAIDAADETADGSDASDVTELHAKRWKYASFFNHMKKQVYQAWEPAAVFKQLPASVTKPLPPTVTIVVHVWLLATGAVDRVTVKTSSTVAELDAEAVRAFRAASPFTPVPDPPPPLDFDFSLYFEIATVTKPLDPPP
ncbi:MAG TPA: energy transducer TonB [Kofleriaceae bacterium]|nr:energy transducer TonB [Kofleriaceae bacterium]